jgi:16S rRNA (cytosine967-C5)-methyltransferase
MMQANPRPPQFSLYKLWEQYLQNESLPQADRWLSVYFKQNKQHGKRDRQWLSQYFFAGLRHALFAIYCEEGADSLSQYKPPQKILARLRRIPAKQFFQSIELRLTASSPTGPESAWHSIPPAFANALQRRADKSWTSEQYQHFLTAQDTQPPLWLRLKNAHLLPEILAQLKHNNLTVTEQRKLTHTIALAVSGTKGLYELPAYQQGQFEIQDLGSQMIGDVITPEHAKSYVLDACAGGGGKTMQIAATLNNQGAVYAYDVREYKLPEIKRRAKKGEFVNVRTFAWDWTQPALPSPPREIEKMGGFDWALVDAPCSSSGTWRRNPDAKWRFDFNGLESLTHLQLQILSQVSKTIRPNGHLVYSTCSFLMEENEDIIEQFLKAHPDFTLLKQALLGCPTENSDTLFVAVLKNKRAPS